MFEFLLAYLLAKFLGVKKSLSTRLCELDLSEYAFDALNNHGLYTVKDVLLAHADTEKLDGVGNGTWTAFFEAVK